MCSSPYTLPPHILVHTRQAYCIFLDLWYSGVVSQCNQGHLLAALLPTFKRSFCPINKPLSTLRTWHTIITSPQTGENPILGTVIENSHYNPRYEDSNRNSQSHSTINDQLSPRQDLPDGGHCMLVAFFYYQRASLALWSDDIRQDHSINNFSFQDGQICLKKSVGHPLCHYGIKK